MKTFDTKTSWAATVTGKEPDEQVFLRRQCGPAQVVICVGLKGYDYNKYHKRTPDKWNRSTKDFNIHFATNAGAQFTFAEFEEMNRAVQAARFYLVGLWPNV